jgi:phosphoserine phosphatase
MAATFIPSGLTLRAALVSSIVLITITGPDAPGVDHEVATVLAAHQVEILDIAQSVIHEALNLGLLVALPTQCDSAPMVKDLLYRAHSRGLVVTFRPIESEQYEHWVGLQGQKRHILSFLGSKFGAHELVRIAEIVARRGLTIDRISRLSGRVSRLNPPHRPRACIEFSLRGGSDDDAPLKSELFEAAQQLGVDMALQVDNIYRRHRRLVAFDMDSTLIQVEVIDELAKLKGVGAEVAGITARAMNGEIDFSTSLRERVALLKGLPVSALDRVCESLPLMDGALRLLATLRRLGFKTAVLSGGFEYFARELQRRLPIDHIVANRLAIRDGVLTGEIEGRIVDGSHKAESLRAIAHSEGLTMDHVIAIGDGANDLPMLGVAGLGIAFHAKPKVRASAKQAISNLGLDGLLYLLGMRDRDIEELDASL